MHVFTQPTFRSIFASMQKELILTPPTLIGEWQSQSTEMPMRELHNVIFEMPLPFEPQVLAMETGAHLPWAEDHFQERVGGHPLNPAPSEAWWPFAQKKQGDTNTDHKSEGKAFSHTYPERMWPKYANREEPQIGKVIRTYPHKGIRFEYGDLGDVIRQLVKSRHTRQAFLPIWFPEDTGAVHGKRVPCTLGYQFTIRGSKLSITYFMRSTDLLRHLQDDIYLAGRLAQHVAHEVSRRLQLVDELALRLGKLTFHTVNLHIFDGDVPMIEYRRSQGQTAWPE